MITVKGVNFQREYDIRGKIYKLNGRFGWHGDTLMAQVQNGNKRCFVDSTGRILRGATSRQWFQAITDA